VEPIRRRIARALTDGRIRDGIAQAVIAASKRHIARGVGRGNGGRESQLAPLKPVYGHYWTSRKPPQGTIPADTRTRNVTKQVKGKDGKIKVKVVKVTEYLMTGASYRNGGQPLRDTGNLQRSLSAKSSLDGPGRIGITIAGALYGLFHEQGFSTSGPNFIPLTRKGKRTHATGANPRSEGLLPGRDYIMARKGVTVPKRPFLVPTNAEWADIGRTIRLGLAKVLKGRI
jgi:phage gpG-like protein